MEIYQYVLLGKVILCAFLFIINFKKRAVFIAYGCSILLTLALSFVFEVLPDITTEQIAIYELAAAGILCFFYFDLIGLKKEEK